MRNLFCCIFILIPILSFSQQPKKESSVSFYGFVRNDFYLDTYKGVNAFQDVFYLFPNYFGVDANGHDINNQASANLLSIVTRGGVNIAGPDIFGAKTSGCIEVDFAGKPEVYLLRLRKAYALFTWPKSKLLFGQDWHPFWSGDAFPKIGALNTGSPFQPFNRSPQLRYDYLFGGFKLYAAAVYQQQYVSSGPIGASNMYKRDAVLPEMVFGWEYNHKSLTLGAGIDYNTIKPRVATLGSDGKLYNSDQYVNSTSLMGYGKYAQGKLMMLLKGYYGQNMAHLTMVGGYGVKSYDEKTGRETYTNMNTCTALFNITYGAKWKPGLFLGYLKNLGTSDPLFNKGGRADIYGLGTNIMNMVRVSPSITYVLVSKFQLTAEYELSAANYGVGQFKFSDGLYTQTHCATNHGTRIVMTYFF